jgi:predicted enzyme related to lactoylglutathione lyase
MGRAVHFEIHASNPLQLVDFYSSLFAYVKDPDSNIQGMMQSDQRAA